MIKKFSLYGFLKNLRFFEPFFLLFLREKGLSFLEVGFLFSFREICVNLMEVPSGALADLFGRKSAMLLSLSSYTLSFIIFGASTNIYTLYVAMFFFAIGEAFRTGTHKAMIFDWLRQQQMQEKKTEVYGYTRSWAQVGSAISVVLAGALVFYSGKYSYVFWFSIFPYLAGLLNMAFYPASLNKASGNASLIGILKHLWMSLKRIVKDDCGLRHLIIKSMIFTGIFKSLKDYLQIMIKAQMLALPILAALDDDKRTAILVAVVYFVLYLLNSYSSKKAHSMINFAGGNERASLFIVVITLLMLVLSGVGVYLNIYAIPILCFVVFFNMHNIWKPMLMSQFDDCAASEEQATILSIESQAVSIGVFILAPLIGYFADNYGMASIFILSAAILFLYFIFALGRFMFTERA